MAGYVNCPYTADEWRDILKSASSQLIEMQQAVGLVRRMERYASQTPPKPGYDIFPIDDDANAAMQTLMTAKWGNILGNIGAAASLALFRYKYVIQPGRPAGFVTATVAVVTGSTVVWDDGGAARSTFSECITGGASAGDRVTLSWDQANGVRRIVTGLIVDALITDGVNKGIDLTIRINPELVVNGDMNPDTDWMKGAGWTIAGGVADAAGALDTALSSAAAITVVAGRRYTLTYTMTRSAGTLTPSFDGVSLTSRALSGTYTDYFYPADASGVLAFTGAGFTGTLDDVSLVETMPVADNSVEVELEATYVP